MPALIIEMYYCYWAQHVFQIFESNLPMKNLPEKIFYAYIKYIHVTIRVTCIYLMYLQFAYMLRRRYALNNHNNLLSLDPPAKIPPKTTAPFRNYEF